MAARLPPATEDHHEKRSVDFAPVAEALRERIRAFYADTGESLDTAAGHNTLETNSGWVERRTAPLLGMLERYGAPAVEGARVVDVGCGFGALAVFFAAHGGRVSGVDPNAERLAIGRDIAARFDLPVELTDGWMEDLPFPDEAFDLAVVNNSLCYVVDKDARRAALEELHRVLRPGGVAILRNPNRWHPRDQFTGLPAIHLLPPDMANRVVERRGRQRSHVRLKSPAGAKRELRRAGFRRVKHVPSPGSAARQAAKSVARYQHLLARRPG